MTSLGKQQHRNNLRERRKERRRRRGFYPYLYHIQSYFIWCSYCYWQSNLVTIQDFDHLHFILLTMNFLLQNVLLFLLTFTSGRCKKKIFHYFLLYTRLVSVFLLVHRCERLLIPYFCIPKLKQFYFGNWNERAK